MCLIAIAYRASDRYPFVVAANRDESHARPSAAAAWWHDRPHVLGGRDLEAGGTWLALDRRGRFGAVTNLRGDGVSASLHGARPSRGLLVTRYLAAAGSAAEFAAALDAEAPRYAPFNLLLYDSRELRYVSNRAPERNLGRGIHAFSNTAADEPWPKIVRAREGLEQILENGPTTEALLSLLAERTAPSGLDPRQTALFQLDPTWGTRSSTVVLIRDDGRARFTERRFDTAGRHIGEDAFEFELEAT